MEDCSSQKRQRKNLKRMYMIKPTLWTKWLFRTWGYILRYLSLSY